MLKTTRLKAKSKPKPKRRLKLATTSTPPPPPAPPKAGATGPAENPPQGRHGVSGPLDLPNPPPTHEPHPESEAKYPNPRPKPGDKDWVAGSPVTDEEASKTEKEALDKLAAGKKAYEEQEKAHAQGQAPSHDKDK